MAEHPRSRPLCSRPLSCGSFTIPAEHPCLAGHFPGNPVVPAMVLLDHALVLLLAAHPGQRVHSLRLVRFRRLVRPAQPIEVQAAPARRELVDFDGVHDGAVVFSGSVRLHRA